MRRTSRLPAARALALGTAALLSAACSRGVDAESGGTLRFTAIPDHNTTELQEKFQPVAGYLARELGVAVEYQPAVDYGASVEAFKNGDVHLAWFGGLTGVRARLAVPGARAIAQGKIDPEFRSYFIANAKTGIERSEEFPLALAGKSFTFGEQSSTSGRLMPEHFLRQATGKTPQEFFGGEMQFSTGHDQTAKLVEAGTYEAGVMNFKTYDTMVAEGRLDSDACRIVWVTPPYPDYNWTAHPELERMFGAGFTDRLQAALLAMQDPALLKAVDRPEGLIAAANEDFAPLEGLAQELGLIR